MRRPKMKLRHRCRVKRLTATPSTGAPSYTWATVASNVPCHIDLAFIRRGKDPTWTQEAGRAPDRSGVLFLARDAPVISGDRIEITFPTNLAGRFSLDGAIDLATAEDLHHLEVGVTEVPGTERAEGL